MWEGFKFALMKHPVGGLALPISLLPRLVLHSMTLSFLHFEIHDPPKTVKVLLQIHFGGTG